MIVVAKANMVPSTFFGISLAMMTRGGSRIRALSRVVVTAVVKMTNGKSGMCIFKFIRRTKSSEKIPHTTSVIIAHLIKERVSELCSTVLYNKIPAKRKTAPSDASNPYYSCVNPATSV